MMESTEEVGLHVPYSPVSPVGPLNRFRDRAQHSLPDLRSKIKGFIRALPRLFSIGVGLNAWPQAPRDGNQFGYLVLGSRDRGDKTRKNPFRAQLAAGHLRGPQPDSQIRWPESNRVMPTSQCQAFSLSSGPFGPIEKNNSFLILFRAAGSLTRCRALTNLCRLGKGQEEVFPMVEVRHLHAVIVLAEELNFTRAADRLHITQPALSKQITDLEAEHRFHLFTRDTRRAVELTDAGRAFVEEARSALFHTERAVHLAHAAHNGSNSVLTVGHSPFANHDWISAMLAIRLPLYPRLGIRLMTQFAMESVQGVLVGEVNLALVTAPPQHSQITSVP